MRATPKPPSSSSCSSKGKGRKGAAAAKGKKAAVFGGGGAPRSAGSSAVRSRPPVPGINGKRMLAGALQAGAAGLPRPPSNCGHPNNAGGAAGDSVDFFEQALDSSQNSLLDLT